MTIADIKEILKHLEKLTDEEEKVLVDFEKRISFLYDNKKLVRAIINYLLRLRDNLEHGIDNVIVNKIVSKIDGLTKKLNEVFHNLLYPDSLSHLTAEQKSILEQENTEKLAIYNELKQLSRFSKETAQKILSQLNNLYALDTKESKLLTEFQKSIFSFKKIIEALRNTVQEELSQLSEIKNTLTANPGSLSNELINSWCFHLKNVQSEIERLLKAEKEVIHEPLEKLFKEERRSHKLAKKLAKKGALSLSDVKHDIQTFTRPEEFNFYKNILLRLDARKKLILPDNVREFLMRYDFFNALGHEHKTYFSHFLKRLAYIDHLTKLRNRHYFEDELKKRLASASRRNVDYNFALLLMDIDFFKMFNDNYGHNIGDIVLKKVAKWIQEIVQRDNDMVIRWGGEEILVLLESITDSKVAYAMAERIRKHIESSSLKVMEEINKTAQPKQKIDKITVSIGIAFYPRDIELNGYNYDELIKHVVDVADKKLYQAKHSGRNKVVY